WYGRRPVFLQFDREAGLEGANKVRSALGLGHDGAGFLRWTIGRSALAMVANFVVSLCGWVSLLAVFPMMGMMDVSIPGLAFSAAMTALSLVPIHQAIEWTANHPAVALGQAGVRIWIPVSDFEVVWHELASQGARRNTASTKDWS